MTAPELSWVLPLYGTSAHLDELLERLARTSARLDVPYEIVMVDDACPDGSGSHAERAATAIPVARVLRLPTNRGQDGALREGLRACRGRWAVLLDADLQDPPEAVAQLWSQRGPDRDAVFANRVGTYTTAPRRRTSWLYRGLVSAMTGLPTGACLFVLLNRRLIDRIAATQRPRISILAVIAASRSSCHSIPIERAPRPSGRSAYDARRRWRKGIGSLWQMALARHLGVEL